MHRYLRAIGFSKVKNKKHLDKLLKDIIMQPDMEKLAIDSEGNEFFELVRKFNDHVGITVCGEYQEDNSFYIDYFYPVFWGEGVTTTEAVEIERHMENESYAGVCDEMRLGVTLIFYLQNVADYLNQKNAFGSFGNHISATLSALSLSGKIILPISKDEKQIENIEKNNRNRNCLIAAAREGDEEAIESLTLEDMDTYSMISRRLEKEDVFSIVDSYFMPYGIESDHYSILGEILEVKSSRNDLTDEELYILKVNANDMVFDICINKMDLFGEPLAGRRFKGYIWMQGKMNYQN